MAERTIQIDGVDVTFDVRTNRVSKMSDWTRCVEFFRRGFFTQISGGPGTFGHVDFIVVPSVRWNGGQS